ncbi:MAG TPA: hypothetical protein VFI12_04660 [Thermomicrobiales bacterium]|nr:hypothetical protein [Thermomicrobiales bacterium]
MRADVRLRSDGRTVTGKLPEGRRFGVSEGRTERIERMVRSEYPDGTVVDSEPVEVAQGAVPTWAGIAGMFTRMKEPPGTSRRVFTRRVTVEAGPWTEVVVPTDGPAEGRA